METEVTFWGRLMGYGSLIVESSADQPLKFRNVASLSKVQATLNQLIRDERERHTQRAEDVEYDRPDRRRVSREARRRRAAAGAAPTRAELPASSTRPRSHRSTRRGTQQAAAPAAGIPRRSRRRSPAAGLPAAGPASPATSRSSRRTSSYPPQSAPRR